MKNGKRTFNATLALSRVNLADLRAFVPDFAAIARPLLVRASVSGVGKRILHLPVGPLHATVCGL
jgi:uncharacterized protein YhdP